MSEVNDLLADAPPPSVSRPNADVVPPEATNQKYERLASLGRLAATCGPGNTGEQTHDLPQYTVPLPLRSFPDNPPRRRPSDIELPRTVKNRLVERRVYFLASSTRSGQKISPRRADPFSVSQPNADVVPSEAVKLALERTHYLTITAL
ncbi:hypothetical protein Bbelb_028670 [Branchiostoma belcheri]|nr:hypothetical protein Bbelb_028670 [Branchiostoma belcheri]